MALTVDQRNALGMADRKEIERHLKVLRRSWKKGRLLPLKNRYRIDCIEKITEDRTPPRALQQPDIEHYIAASTFLHCMDGWSFLGRAIQSYLNGDAGAAIHLAYYAELRSAMSLLASEGIGVFSREHCVTASTGLTLIPPVRGAPKPGKPANAAGPGTHHFVWDALQEWATSPKAETLILTIISAGGFPLRDWLTGFGVGAGMSGLVGRDWLTKWGLDLQRLAIDREARNLVSYRSTSMTPSVPDSPEDSLSFVKGLWDCCQPVGEADFQNLDIHLVRLSLRTAFRSGHPSNPGKSSEKQAPRLYGRMVDNLLHQLGPRQHSPDFWADFLKFAKLPDLPTVVEQASGTAKSHEKGHARQVLSRAVLLLRLASGSCRLLLGSLPDFSRNDLEFWWQKLGEERAIWHHGEAVADFGDLWADIGDALIGIDNWMAITPRQDRSHRRMRSGCAESVAALGTCERIGLWGML